MAADYEHPELDDVDLDTVLAALADPQRRRVVVELVEAGHPGLERTCASFELPAAKSTRTYHWRVLREAGLVFQRAAGNTNYLRLRRDEFEARFPGLLASVAALHRAESATKSPR